MDERLQKIKDKLLWIDDSNIYQVFKDIHDILEGLINYIDEKEREAKVAPYTQELDPNV